MPPISLQDAVSALYRKARLEGGKTSTTRLKMLAEFSVQQLELRGLAGAVPEPVLHGFARDKDWDVAWLHHGKARLAISLKSLLTNLGGTVPNRIDDLIGEVASLQMYSPEIVVGYLVLFNIEEDEESKKHGCTWGQLFRTRLLSISGRRAPHWTIGTVEAVAMVEVDFAQGPRVVSGENEVAAMFDTLTDQVYQRHPDLVRPRR
ncbi:MAG: hypothetical protein HYZ53_22465 [Planctomycetes bacterium]|nr:hypothetical protein [Planctomycetota bacterium]